MSEMLEQAVIDAISEWVGETTSDHLVAAARAAITTVRCSAVSAQPASCDACKKPFAESDDVVLMGARGNFHQSCFLARAEPQSLPLRGPDCACCEQRPRKDCTVPGCTMKDAGWALERSQAVCEDGQ
jgi:hypothetical protein